jgi:hypothetical protein
MKNEIYAKSIDTICQMYDYSLYAKDFNYKKLIDRLKKYYSDEELKKNLAQIGYAIRDFFDAINQKITLKAISLNDLKFEKKFDRYANTEVVDRKIHALRTNLFKIYYATRDKSRVYISKEKLEFLKNILKAFPNTMQNQIIISYIKTIWELPDAAIVLNNSGIYIDKKIQDTKSAQKQREQLGGLHNQESAYAKLKESKELYNKFAKEVKSLQEEVVSLRNKLKNMQDKIESKKLTLDTIDLKSIEERNVISLEIEKLAISIEELTKSLKTKELQYIQKLNLAKNYKKSYEKWKRAVESLKDKK